MNKYPQKNFTNAVVAVDTVLFTLIDEKLHVLLVKIKNENFENSWALPGGLVKAEESLEDAVSRHLKIKANVKDVYVEQLYTFGDVHRDPLGRVVSVAYYALANSRDIAIKTTDRYASIEWHPVDSLPNLAYDHLEIIKMAVKRLKNKLYYSNIVFSLMPSEFTLTELQITFENIIGSDLDKRNFRRKILATGLLKKTGRSSSGSGHRPAMLYRFKDKTYKEVDII